MELLTLCETLKANAQSVAATVVRRWDEIAGAEPWLALPPQLDYDHLPDLIRALASAALCTEYDRDLCRTVVEIAAVHGAHRAEEGFGENLIHREYHLLRRGLAERLKQEHGDTAGIYYGIMRIDALISLAGAAALHGLHRGGLQDPVPGELDELLSRWPLPRA